jgi:hypothetical protein
VPGCLRRQGTKIAYTAICGSSTAPTPDKQPELPPLIVILHPPAIPRLFEAVHFHLLGCFSSTLDIADFQPRLALLSIPSYAMPATTADTLSLVTRTVTVAPLVLLSVADHYGRSAKGTRKRVVGVLLGEHIGQNVRVSNSFAGMQPPSLALSVIPELTYLSPV